MKVRFALLLLLILITGISKAVTISDLATYQNGCEGGNAESCGMLGFMYNNERDYITAANLYQKACDGGYALGCSNLGVLYANGQGVKQDNFIAGKFQASCRLDVKY